MQGSAEERRRRERQEQMVIPLGMIMKYGFIYCGGPFFFDRVCSGDTPLHLSVGKGSVDNCEVLLKSGADVNAKNKW